MTAVTATPALGSEFRADSFADLVPFAVRSMRWTEDRRIRVDFDDSAEAGGPITAAQATSVRRRIAGVVDDFDPSTADLAQTKAALADLIKLALGESD